MDKKLHQEIEKAAFIAWDKFCVIYPRLVRFELPEIVLNNRFTNTGGECDQHDRIIQIGAKFVKNNRREIFKIVLPHELAHQVDFDLYGESEKSCGHGKKWIKIMLAYGIPANVGHDMKL